MYWSSLLEFFLLQETRSDLQMNTLLSIMAVLPTKLVTGFADWRELSKSDIEYLNDLLKERGPIDSLDEEHYFVLGGKPNPIVQYDATLVLLI